MREAPARAIATDVESRARSQSTTRCPRGARSSSTVRDLTKPQPPVWRVCSSRKDSNRFVPSPADLRHGSKRDIRSRFMSDSVYIHGTTEEEQRRLSLMNDVLLNNAALREMSLRGDERIIDFGSGLGQFSRAMAHALPRGRVVGIERDENQLAEATRLAAGDNAAVDFRHGDVLNLDLPREEWGSYDIAHAR